MEKHDLIMFTNMLNICFPLLAVERQWLSGKENGGSAVVSKEGDADSLLGHERN